MIKTVIFGKNGFVGKSLDIPDSICPSSKECDLFNYQSVYSFLKNLNTDSINIINLAAKVKGFTYNKDHNTEMLYDNCLLMLNLVKAIKELKIKTYFLNLSSVISYGKSYNEEDIYDGKPNNLTYGYAIGKKMGMYALESLKIDCPDLINYCNLICTNIYGEDDHFADKDAHVIPTLIKKMNSDAKEVDILGNALDKRDFLYVKDLANLIKKSYELKLIGSYNVSTNRSIAIKELALLIKKISNYEGKINFTENPETSNDKAINNHKLMNCTNYSFIDIEKALENTILFYKSNYK
jgi:nucleoside-diphosphate-sugar epimerase